VQGGTIFSSEEIKEAKFKKQIGAMENGKIAHLDVGIFTNLAKEAGAPFDKEAGIYLLKEVGENVKKGEPIFEVYSNSQDKLHSAEEYLMEHSPVSFEKIIIEEVS
jgi:AMP phosphorylase